MSKRDPRSPEMNQLMYCVANLRFESKVFYETAKTQGFLRNSQKTRFSKKQPKHNFFKEIVRTQGFLRNSQNTRFLRNSQNTRFLRNSQNTRYSKLSNTVG
jgi:hypothetical protein